MRSGLLRRWPTAAVSPHRALTGRHGLPGFSDKSRKSVFWKLTPFRSTRRAVFNWKLTAKANATGDLSGVLRQVRAFWVL